MTAAPIREADPARATLAALREDLVASPGPVDVPRVARVLRAQGRMVGAAQLLRMTARLRDEVTGLGPLQDLARPGVTDILVNADGSVWVDDAHGLRRTRQHLAPVEARELAVRLATAGGRRLDDASPCADAHLPDGTRLHAVLPALTGGGTLISLRRPSAKRFGLAELERAGTLSPLGRRVAQAVIASRSAFVISGGTGTGKTTLLGAMLSAADPSERIVIVEDARELEPDHPHTVHLQARHANADGAGGVDLAHLVRQCLRMRPDRVVVGECRGAEVRELLQALNTGHEGGCGTLHANTALDVPARLEALGALGGLGPEALASQAASALDIVLHLSRRGPRRSLTQVGVLGRDRAGALQVSLALDLTGPSPVPGPAAERLCARLGLAPAEIGMRADLDAGGEIGGEIGGAP